MKQTRTISFSGYEWTVKSGEPPHGPGPGPNYFSDSEENVWVDEKGHLHLRLTSRDGVWYCAEVDSVRKSFGHGKYVFDVSGPIDRLDTNVVLGLFTYDCGAPEQNHREIDIEFSKWGKKLANSPGLFSVVPGWVEGNKVSFDFRLDGQLTTHSFHWKAESIVFESHQEQEGRLREIRSWKYTGKDNPPPGDERCMINLWLFKGLPPDDGKEVEIVIRKFEFIP